MAAALSFTNTNFNNNNNIFNIVENSAFQQTTFTLVPFQTSTTAGTYTYVPQSMTQTSVNFHNICTGTASTGTITYGDTYGLTGNITCGGFIIDRQKAFKESIKQLIRNNLLIKVNNNRNCLASKYTPEEQKARDTLRDMLTEKEWRRYITNGFIMVKGSCSDYWYQIFSDKNVRVYHQNKLINSICIHSDRTCPPTDHVINMKILVELDEKVLWANGNIHTPPPRYKVTAQKPKNIVEEYLNLKNNVHIVFTSSSSDQLALAS